MPNPNLGGHGRGVSKVRDFYLPPPTTPGAEALPPYTRRDQAALQWVEADPLPPAPQRAVLPGWSVDPPPLRNTAVLLAVLALSWAPSDPQPPSPPRAVLPGWSVDLPVPKRSQGGAPWLLEDAPQPPSSSKLITDTPPPASSSQPRSLNYEQSVLPWWLEETQPPQARRSVLPGWSVDPPQPRRSDATSNEIIALWEAPDPLPTLPKRSAGLPGWSVNAPLPKQNPAILEGALLASLPPDPEPILPKRSAGLPGWSVDAPPPQRNRALLFSILESWLPPDPLPTLPHRDDSEPGDSVDNPIPTRRGQTNAIIESWLSDDLVIQRTRSAGLPGWSVDRPPIRRQAPPREELPDDPITQRARSASLPGWSVDPPPVRKQAQPREELPDPPFVFAQPRVPGTSPTPSDPPPVRGPGIQPWVIAAWEAADSFPITQRARVPGTSPTPSDSPPVRRLSILPWILAAWDVEPVPVVPPRRITREPPDYVATINWGGGGGGAGGYSRSVHLRRADPPPPPPPPLPIFSDAEVAQGVAGLFGQIGAKAEPAAPEKPRNVRGLLDIVSGGIAVAWGVATNDKSAMISGAASALLGFKKRMTPEDPSPTDEFPRPDAPSTRPDGL